MCTARAWRGGGLSVSASPTVLDAVAIFPVEAGVVGGGADVFVVERCLLGSRRWRVVVLGADHAPRVVVMGGEAVKYSFRGAAGVFGEESAMRAEQGLVGAALKRRGRPRQRVLFVGQSGVDPGEQVVGGDEL